jgi:putative transposase
MRNALAHVPKGQHSMVAAAIRTAFAQETPATASTAWRHVADQLRPRFGKLARLMDEAESDVASPPHTGPNSIRPTRSNA